MDKPVRQHIEELQRRTEYLSAQLMDGQKAKAELNRLDAELRVTHQALEHYRKALELEKQLQTRSMTEGRLNLLVEEPAPRHKAKPDGI